MRGCSRSLGNPSRRCTAPPPCAPRSTPSLGPTTDDAARPGRCSCARRQRRRRAGVYGVNRTWTTRSSGRGSARAAAVVREKGFRPDVLPGHSWLGDDLTGTASPIAGALAGAPPARRQAVPRHRLGLPRRGRLGRWDALSLALGMHGAAYILALLGACPGDRGCAARTRRRGEVAPRAPAAVDVATGLARAPCGCGGSPSSTPAALRTTPRRELGQARLRSRARAVPVPDVRRGARDREPPRRRPRGAGAKRASARLSGLLRALGRSAWWTRPSAPRRPQGFSLRQGGRGISRRHSTHGRNLPCGGALQAATHQRNHAVVCPWESLHSGESLDTSTIPVPQTGSSCRSHSHAEGKASGGRQGCAGTRDALMEAQAATSRPTRRASEGAPGGRQGRVPRGRAWVRRLARTSTEYAEVLAAILRDQALPSPRAQWSKVRTVVGAPDFADSRCAALYEAMTRAKEAGLLLPPSSTVAARHRWCPLGPVACKRSGNSTRCKPFGAPRAAVLVIADLSRSLASAASSPPGCAP